MLDKLSLSKITLTIFALLCCSCGQNREYYYVDVICNERTTVTARYVTIEEVRTAIVKAQIENRVEGTNLGYTALKFPGKRSFRIEKIPPDEAVKCKLRQRFMDKKSKGYIRYIESH